MPNTRYIDGSQAYGSASITIDSVAYIVNSFNVTRPTTEAIDYDVNGLPARRRSTLGLAEFSAELQLAASNTAHPQHGDTFTYEVDPNFASELWVVDSCVPNISNDAGAMRTLSVTGKKVINGSVTAS
jgi:hypothetical protein